MINSDSHKIGGETVLTDTYTRAGGGRGSKIVDCGYY